LLEETKRHKIPKFVYISSSMVYGDFDNDVTEDYNCRPQGQYGIMKLMGEHLVKDYTRRGCFDHVIIRPSAVYGEYDVEDRVVSKFMTMAMRGETLKVKGADEVLVTMSDKREFKAKIIGSDRRTDVAVVKIDSKNLPTITLGGSSKVRVGEWVIAIGSPFGLENTVTAGIVSAIARDTGDYLPLIQTDVAVNPGNSGGPLINMRGEVIGINSQIYSRSGGYMGISFAVPIDEAIRVSEQLKTIGRVVRGRIGVQIGEVTKEVAESLGLPRAAGALVARVEPGSPAEAAGVEAGDIITHFNSVGIEKSGDLPRLVGNTKPGSQSVISVWRKGAKKDLNVIVAELEAEAKVVKKEEKKPKQEQTLNALGLIVTDLSDAQKRELKLDGGVLIELADGPASRAGLQPGDVVVRLNNTDIKDAKQFNGLVAKLDTNKNALLLVRRGDSSQFIPLRPTKP
jgi:serine protease Do